MIFPLILFLLLIGFFIFAISLVSMARLDARPTPLPPQPAEEPGPRLTRLGRPIEAIQVG